MERTLRKYGSAAAANSFSGSALGFDERVAMKSLPAPARAASIASASLSRRMEATIVQSRPGGSRSTSQATPSGVWAPSRISFSPRRSSRPGSSTCGSAAIGRPRKASAAARAPPATTGLSGTRVRNSSSGRTTVAPGPATASFSRAIASRVSPRTSVCSRLTFVSSTTGASITFVASSRPPRPASITAASTPSAANCANAAAVRVSNCVAFRRVAASRTRATARSKDAASVSSRSSQPATCGDVYAPTLRPSLRSSAAIVRVAVDLPFVPTTWTLGKRRCGLSSASRSARIRSRPNSSGHGLRPAIQSVADCVELTAVARELLALGSDDLDGRVAHEALVREHLLGTLDLCAQARALGVDVPVRLLALGLDDRVEDPAALVVELRRQDAAPTEDGRELLHLVERARVRRVAGRRPRRDDEPRLAARQVRPDLLRDVRHRRVQELQQADERRERGRLRIGVAVVEPLLDRLRVPVAEVVERQVVELVDEVREVELAEQALELELRLGEAREDPALLERPRALVGRRACRRLQDQPRHVPELVGELAPLLDRALGERHVLRRRHLHQAVPRRVGAVAVDERERVHAGAEALRHAAAGRRVHERMDDDVAERHVAHQLEPDEDHPVLPEADDVAPGRVEIAGIERAQVLGVVRPAERRERPELRREPA